MSEKWVVDLARELRILYSKVMMEAPEYVPTVTDGVAMIERALALRDVPQGQTKEWIDCKVRMPDEEGPWLVRHLPAIIADDPDLNSDLYVAYFSDHTKQTGRKFWSVCLAYKDSEELRIEDVTHWRKLPEIPEQAARQVPVSSAEEKGRS